MTPIISVSTLRGVIMSNLQQIRGLLAYHYGPNPRIVPVATEHVQINGGFSVPRLTGWFSATTKVLSAFVVSKETEPGLHCTTFLVMCSQFDDLLPPKGVDTCELLIFRKGVFGDALVNLRTGDVKHMEGVIKW
jgi:hypothetical protein